MSYTNITTCRRESIDVDCRSSLPRKFALRCSRICSSPAFSLPVTARRCPIPVDPRLHHLQPSITQCCSTTSVMIICFTTLYILRCWIRLASCSYSRSGVAIPGKVIRFRKKSKPTVCWYVLPKWFCENLVAMDVFPAVPSPRRTTFRSRSLRVASSSESDIPTFELRVQRPLLLAHACA